MKVSIFGAGKFGTAMGYYIAKHKHKDVCLYDRNRGRILDIRASKERYYIDRGIRFPKNMYFTDNLDEAIDFGDIWFIAVPFQAMREVISAIASYGKLPYAIVNLSKGIDIDSGMLFSDIIKEYFPDAYDVFVVLSGPTFADEILKLIPSLMVSAGRNEERYRFMQEFLSSDIMRIYALSDYVGVQLGGALKNIYAIGSGIIDGLGLGYNTKSGFICRALSEMKRIVVRFGGDERTLFGISGLGDLMATSFSKLSRNRLVGELIGKGKKIDEIMEMNILAEGIWTLKSVKKIADRSNIELPIMEAIYSVLFDKMLPDEAIENLMLRPLKNEF
jgi:glycerol-3-phosphate dehydrogenase (NAD(P)+)